MLGCFSSVYFHIGFGDQTLIFSHSKHYHSVLCLSKCTSHKKTEPDPKWDSADEGII